MIINIGFTLDDIEFVIRSLQLSAEESVRRSPDAECEDDAEELLNQADAAQRLRGYIETSTEMAVLRKQTAAVSHWHPTAN